MQITLSLGGVFGTRPPLALGDLYVGLWFNLLFLFYFLHIFCSVFCRVHHVALYGVLRRMMC